MFSLKGRDIFDILLDETNDSDIVILDSNNIEVVFEQIMTIPYHNEYIDKDEIYCILHPKKSTKEFDSNLVYPFLVYNNSGHYELKDVEDEEILEYLNNVYLNY